MKFCYSIFFLSIFQKIISSPASVIEGGSGKTSFTPYAVICGGTATFNPLQSIASLGTSGQVFQSQGAAALPQFVTYPNKLLLIKTVTASSSASLSFTSSEITSSFATYIIMVNGLVPASNPCSLLMNWSTNNGSTYLSSNYLSGLNFLTYDSAGAFTNSSSTTTCPLSYLYTGSLTGDEGQTEFCAMITLQGFNTSASTGPSYYGLSMYFNTTPKLVTAQLFGFNSGSSNINNIKFSFISIPGGSPVNITSGSISLYGSIPS